MLKIFEWFISLSCIIALSCWKLEGFPTSGSRDSNLSEPVTAQEQKIHVLRHAGFNQIVGLEAKKCDKEEEHQKKQEIFLSIKTSHKGNGGGGTNIPHRGHRSKNAASSLAKPLNFFLLTIAMFHLSLAVILASPSLLLKLF